MSFPGDVIISGSLQVMSGILSNQGFNTSFGTGALGVVTTGIANTAFGSGANAAVKTGNNNSAFGTNALLFNVAGLDNSAFGVRALSTTTGGQNSAFGMFALNNLTSGSGNSAFGRNSGNGLTTGSNNTVLGANVTGLAAALTGNIILAIGSGAIKLQFDGTNWAFTGKVYPAQDTGVAQAISGIFAGTGVPNNANGANGDFYFRGDTPATATQRLYIKSAGAWVATAL